MFRTWNGFSIESKAFEGKAITLNRTSSEITINEINNSTMEQLLVLNSRGELSNREFGKFINSDSIDDEKVIAGDSPSSQWQLGIIFGENVFASLITLKIKNIIQFNPSHLFIVYHSAYTVSTTEDGALKQFGRIKQPQGVWPFRCNKLIPCDNIRQQSCGCEEEGDPSTSEKTAIVYYFTDIIEGE